MLLCIHNPGCCWCIGGGDISFSTLWAQVSNSAVFKHQRLNLIAAHGHTFRTTVYHLLVAASSRITYHDTKLTSLQTGEDCFRHLVE